VSVGRGKQAILASRPANVLLKPDGRTEYPAVRRRCSGSSAPNPYRFLKPACGGGRDHRRVVSLLV